MAHFLESVRADSYLFPTVSRNGVLMLPSSMSIGDALKKLVDAHITGAPMTHPTEDGLAIHSWITLLDIVVAASKVAHDPKAPKGFMHLTIGSVVGQTKADKFLTIPNTATLLEVAKLMVNNQAHRVAVGLGEKHTTAPLTTVISDSKLIRILLAATCEETGPWKQTLRERGLVGNREPLCVAMDAPVIQAFEKMAKEGVRSIAVIERDFETTKKLIGVISASDLAKLMVDDLKARIDPMMSLPAELQLTVKDFLQWRDAASETRPQHPSDLVYATSNMTVEECARRMVGEDVHKLFLVNGMMEIHGVITIDDLIRQYLPQSE